MHDVPSPCAVPWLKPKVVCVCFGVCFSWSRLALFIAQTCTNHCNMQTNEAPFVRRKTSSGDSSMGHPPCGNIYPSSWCCCFRLLQFVNAVFFLAAGCLPIRTVNAEAVIEAGTVVPRQAPGTECETAANMGERTAVITGHGYMLPVAFISTSNGMSFANLGLKPCSPSLSAGCNHRNTFRCLSGRPMSWTEKTKRYRFAVVSVQVLSIVIR